MPRPDAQLVGLFALYADRAWCIKPEAMDVLVAALDQGVQASAAPLPAAPQPRRSRSVAIVPLHGMIRPAGSAGLAGELLGAGGGLEEFRANLRMAVADPTVSRVVLDINSPGGLVDQVPETAAEIRQLREIKPIIALANTQAASAAYWLASQASELVSTPSGELGSIGAFSLHTDKSGALAKEGVKVTVMSAGRYKSEGNPYQPLDAEARDARQAKVNRYYEKFLQDVAEGRGVSVAAVRHGYGQGRTLVAEDAVDAGLADRVATLSETVGSALSAPTAPSRQEITPARAQAIAASVMDLGIVEARPFRESTVKRDWRGRFAKKESNLPNRPNAPNVPSLSATSGQKTRRKPSADAGKTPTFESLKPGDRLISAKGGSYKKDDTPARTKRSDGEALDDPPRSYGDLVESNWQTSLPDLGGDPVDVDDVKKGDVVQLTKGGAGSWYDGGVLEVDRKSNRKSGKSVTLFDRGLNEEFTVSEEEFAQMGPKRVEGRHFQEWSDKQRAANEAATKSALRGASRAELHDVAAGDSSHEVLNQRDAVMELKQRNLIEHGDSRVYKSEDGTYYVQDVWSDGEGGFQSEGGDEPYPDLPSALAAAKKTGDDPIFRDMNQSDLEDFAKSSNKPVRKAARQERFNRADLRRKVAARRHEAAVSEAKSGVTRSQLHDIAAGDERHPVLSPRDAAEAIAEENLDRNGDSRVNRSEDDDGFYVDNDDEWYPTQALALAAAAKQGPDPIYSQLSDSALRARAAKGDSKAQAELDKRAATR